MFLVFSFSSLAARVSRAARAAYAVCTCDLAVCSVCTCDRDWRARMTASPPKGLPLNHAYLNLQNVDWSWGEIDCRFRVARNQDEVILHDLAQTLCRRAVQPKALASFIWLSSPQQMQHTCRKRIFGVCRNIIEKANRQRYAQVNSPQTLKTFCFGQPASRWILTTPKQSRSTPSKALCTQAIGVQHWLFWPSRTWRRDAAKIS